MALVGVTRLRASGEQSPARVAGAVAGARAGALAAGPVCEVVCACDGPVLCIDVDPVDERYLLATDSRAVVTLLDLDRRAAAGEGAAMVARARPRPGAMQSSSSGPAGATRRGTPRDTVDGHTRAISSVAWYPVDTGLFATGGFDSRVVTWDTERFTPSFAWTLDGKVYCIAMSPIATRHALLATATADARIRLIDLAACGFAQTLVGHTDAVLSVAWHPGHEYVLASGSRDGSIRLWDVRRTSTALLVLGRSADTSSAPLQRARVGDAWEGSLTRDAAATAAQGAAGRSAHLGGVNAVAWPSSGRDGGGGAPLLSVGADCRMRRWDVEVGRVPLTSSPAPERGDGAATVDGCDLVRCEHVRAVAQLNVNASFPATRNAFRSAVKLAALSLGRPGGVVRGVVFHPDSAKAGGFTGRQLTAGGITAYDSETGVVMGELVGHHGAVNAIVALQRTQEVVSGAEDGLVLRWKPA